MRDENTEIVTVILKRIDGPIEMRLYVSKGKERMPEQLKTYAQSVEDLLAEFRVQSGNQIEIKKFDPKARKHVIFKETKIK